MSLNSPDEIVIDGSFVTVYIYQADLFIEELSHHGL